METGEKGRQADGEEVWVVAGGDEGCMISLLREKKRLIFSVGKNSLLGFHKTCVMLRLFQNT